MLPDIGGESGAKLVMAIAAVAIALLFFFLVLRAWRQRGTRAFLRGGKNRRPRLAVLDAAAVDPRRRLVLVRRDDVEHLILIGGPSDVVVESGIGAPHGAGRRGVVSRRVRGTRRGQLQEGVAPAAGRPAGAAALRQPDEEEDRAATAAEAGEGRQRAACRTGGGRARRTGSAANAAARLRRRVGDRRRSARAAARRRTAPTSQTILDSQRQRVFGSSEPSKRSPYVRAYMDDEEDDANACRACRERTAGSVSFLGPALRGLSGYRGRRRAVVAEAGTRLVSDEPAAAG